MKKKLPIFALLTVVVLFVFAYKNNTINLNEQSANSTSQTEAGEKKIKKRGIARALDFWYKMRVNPETGEVSLNDVLRARKQADHQKALKDASLIQWDFMGPNNVGGRTRAILIDPTNPHKMIAGAVSGGIWTSDDGGLNWSEHPQNLELPCLTISCIARSANGHIYVGTGEKIWGGVTPGNGDSGFAGCGIYKSTDGGTTYSLLESAIPTTNSGTHRWAYIVALATHPTNADWIYAATDVSMYMSKDGGETWISPNGIPDLSGSAWSVIAASNGTIHALVGSQYFKSTDGENFVQKSGPALGNFPSYGNNKKLAVSPTDPNYVYAITTNGSPNFGCLRQVLQSSDGGETWIEIGAGGSEFFEPLGNATQCQGWYDLCIVVDPANKERIFVGGVDMWSWSVNDNWQQVANWFPETPSYPYYVHADKHTFVFHPTNPNILYIGNDGGIARSINAGNLAPTFTTLNRNYNVTQFYSIGASDDGRVLGGTQDNGTQFVTLSGDSYLAGTEVIGGDGGFVDISKINPNVVFGAYVQGALYRSSNGGQSFAGGFLDQNIDCQPLNTEGNCAGDGSVDGSPEFITPTLLWEDVNANLSVFVTGNGIGQVFVTLEGLNVSTVPEWRNIGSFGGSGSGRTVTCVNVSRDVAGRVMVVAGSADGRVLILRNFIVDESVAEPQLATLAQVLKKEISAATVTAGLDNARYVTSVTPDPYNPTSLTVTMGNYGREVYVFRTLNATNTTPVFFSMQGTGDNALPPMPVYDLVIDIGDPNRIFAATEMGVWMCEIIQTGATTFDYIWSEQNDGIGRVPAFRIRQEPIKSSDQVGCYVLYVGTHGKGLYRSTTFTFPTCDTELPDYGSPVGIETPTGKDLAIQVIPNPLVNQGIFKLTINKPTEQATVSVFNTNGQLVCRQIVNGTTGSQTIDVNASDYSAGVYIAIFENGSDKTATKFIVK